MNKKTPQGLPPSASNNRGTKDEIWDAFDNLSDAVLDLMSLHAKIHGDTKTSTRILTSGLEMTNVYTTHIHEVTTALISLGNLLKLKQSGGPKRKSNIEVSNKVLRDHYIKTGKILTAPALVAQYNKTLFGKEDHVDTEGNQELSEKVARADIRIFKLCLPYEDFYRN